MKPMAKQTDIPTTDKSGVSTQDTAEGESQRQTGDSDSGGLIGWVKNLIPTKTHDDESLREAIEELIEDQETAPQSSVAAHERRLISNILNLRDLPVIDVMVPRADIVAINVNATIDELFQFLSEKPHSRIPVYKDDLDNIVGVLHMKDVVLKIARNEPLDIKNTMRDVLVVSPAMRVMDMMLQMRQSKVHIAFVVDEFGGIDGLVTINDLISAIVGEIDDEFDFDIDPELIERPDGSLMADARFAVKDFEEIYGNVFAEDEENEEADTLGGLVTYLAGHVPARGEVIPHSSGIEFEIMDADPRRVMRLRIRNLPPKKRDTLNS